VIATIPVGPSPVGIDVTANGKYVYVVNSTLDFGRGSHINPPATLSVISTATNTVVDTITVGGRPFALGRFIGHRHIPNFSRPSASVSIVLGV
jgi:YVTN family beta-propeller protein